MNRNALFWVLVTFITPFWGLVILSKLDYNFDPEEVKCRSIVKEFKEKLKTLNRDYYWKTIDRRSYQIKRSNLQKEYNSKIEQAKKT